MKKFAGIDLDNYDLAALTPDQMHTIKKSFLDHYSYMSAHANCAKATQVSKHLMKYLKIVNFSPCNDDQLLANVIGNLPEFPVHGYGDNWLLVFYLLAVLKGSDYKHIDLIARKSIVEQKRNHLDFNDDWKASVREYKQAASAACLDVAYLYLKEINDISKQIKPENTQYNEYLLGLQIANYITILEFLRGKANWFAMAHELNVYQKFYDTVHNNLTQSLQTLYRLLNPAAKQHTTSYLSGMFFKWFITDKAKLDAKPVVLRCKNNI